ncbi:MAG: M48 family metalloprotease [Gammaproteobacteria bacterium]|nr:M48 family metalloprotease [Gammaproteobacteria bacterium]
MPIVSATPLIRALAAVLLLSGLTACAVNPVTGQRQLALITTADEIQIGEQYYAPSLQMQGGEYRLDPELTAYVNDIGQRLAEVSDRELPYEFAVLNSSVPNAWALPGGKIAINRGLLLEMRSEAELAAVMGHEIVHAAARHGAQAQQRGMLLQGVLLAGAIAAGDSGFGGLAVGGMSVAAQMVNQRYGRSAELEADRFGMIYMSRAGWDPQGAVELQETFVRLSEGRDQNWLSGLFSSHPPSRDRVRANQATAAELPPGGEHGRERYEQRTARLRAQKPGHDAIDAGRKALAEREFDTALAQAEQAIALLPEEAHGHALRGDIARLQLRPADALGDYSRAIELDPTFFYFTLQRGLARIEVGDWAGAGEDLASSVERLPTVPAFHGLGRVAEQRGDLEEAKSHYRRAAGAASPEGQAALRALLRLDLPDNPGEYLELRHGIDGQGQLVLEISNPQPVAVTGLVVQLRYRDAAGRVRDREQRVDGTLAATSRMRVGTGLGGFTDAAQAQAQLVAARLAE